MQKQYLIVVFCVLSKSHRLVEKSPFNIIHGKSDFNNLQTLAVTFMYICDNTFAKILKSNEIYQIFQYQVILMSQLTNQI